MGISRRASGAIRTVSGSHALDIRIADSFWSRFKGLMLTRELKDDAGLLLKKCSSIHTAFMLYPIDLLYVDDSGVVLQTSGTIRPWSTDRFRGQGLFVLPWRRTRVHAVELPAGTISGLSIRPGDVLNDGTSSPSDVTLASQPSKLAHSKERGAALVEFAVVGPLITLFGLGTAQYGLLFNAKNMVNHSAFMAARAGSFGNANIDTIRTAYIRGLIPLYGGVKNVGDIAPLLTKIGEDTVGHIKIEVLSPTKESFEDWNDPRLQKLLDTKGKRVIPNRNLARNLSDKSALMALGVNHTVSNIENNWVKSKSGQSLQDANILKLRITHGYEPKVPVMKTIYMAYLRWLNTEPAADFRTLQIESGRIPIVSHVTVQMQTDAIESDNTSIPGMGNAGKPKDPGVPPKPKNEPPKCQTILCSDPEQSLEPIVDGGGPSDGGSCPIPKTEVSLDSDVLFAFGKSDLTADGKAKLDKLIADAKAAKDKGETYASVNVIGHTDQLGSPAINDPLSLARAKAVKDYLVSKGFPTGQYTIEGKGSRAPVVSMSACEGKTDAALKDCLAPNRRVVIELIKG
ncbi:MAG: DUF192 domain-containing protein [Aquabacterium sp.]|uniref:OmpA family protein n=1 Tax=Aquabacterium sp. TaxID=1872578 RepID=UPI0025C20749|nr:OmpA family protein [Aquabacterium sp.]MBI5926297.1 DUF192 domain-containing protein [Aquabacterium sp.]